MEEANTEAIFETERLQLRYATDADVDLFYALWNDPRVMASAGYPQGMNLSREQALEHMHLEGDGVLGRHMVIELRNGSTSMGMCFLTCADERSVVTMDVKLFPGFWGHNYEIELKEALLDYLFATYDIDAVESMSSVSDLDVIAAQEDMGGERVSEMQREVPATLRGYVLPMHYYLYRVTREKWEGRKKGWGSRSF